MFIQSENRTKVKICGITNLEDARFASGALADYLGFIFYPESPRYIEPAKAGAINNWIEGPTKVGVFVNQPLDDVNRIVKETGIDMVQLHGNESPEYCSLVDVPIIKAIHISEDSKPSAIENLISTYSTKVDFLLFDTKISGHWGGTGQVFDWSILESISMEIPFFLSGGLNAANIKKSIEIVQPNGVDLSSGLEESPGLKDFDKVEQFFEIMNEIWNEQELGNI
jgi:phosphoribosylanthranilate isomerase